MDEAQDEGFVRKILIVSWESKNDTRHNRHAGSKFSGELGDTK